MPIANTTRAGPALGVSESRGRERWEVSGICWSIPQSHYRHKRALDNLRHGMAPPPTRPKRINRPRWGEAEKQLVFRLRGENPTYGKALTDR